VEGFKILTTAYIKSFKIKIGSFLAGKNCIIKNSKIEYLDE